MTYQKVPIPEPKQGEVLIETKVVTICGSDVHYREHLRCGPFVIQEGQSLILGHETSGTVAAVGPGVTTLKVGDNVAIEPGIPDGTCTHCREGRYNLCPNIKFLATPPFDGSLVKYFTHRADFCYKLPPHVSLEVGALLEPLSVGIQAIRRGQIGVGSHVLITGAGPVGLVTLAACKAAGATKIILVDLLQHRLDVAIKMGADECYLANDPKLLEKITQHSITQTIECSGAESALLLAIQATSPGGKILSIGRSAKPTQNLPLFEAMDREVDILGSFRYHDSYPAALELVASGKVDVSGLITHRFAFDRAEEAFEFSASGKGVKTAIVVAGAKL